jgi:hypothetical protein
VLAGAEGAVEEEEDVEALLAGLDRREAALAQVRGKARMHGQADRRKDRDQTIRRDQTMRRDTD